MLVNWKIVKLPHHSNNIPDPNQIIPNEKYWFFKNIKKENISIDVIGISTSLKIINYIENKIKIYAIQAIQAFFKRNQYDYILSHSANSGFIFAIIKRILGFKKPKHIIIDIGSLNGGRINSIQIKILGYILKSVDWFCYHAKITGKFYKEFFPHFYSKSSFIPFGVNYKDFHIEHLTEEKYILSFGYKKRDWNTLIKAVHGLKIRLLIVSNCSYINLPKNIIIIPPKNINQLKKYIAKSQFIILPLTDHPYSIGQMSLLQSMSMGKVVIASNVPGIRDYIEDNKTGLLYPPHRYDILRKKILYLKSNKNFRKKIGIAARKIIINKFNEQNMARNVYNILKNLETQHFQ